MTNKRIRLILFEGYLKWEIQKAVCLFKNVSFSQSFRFQCL